MRLTAGVLVPILAAVAQATLVRYLAIGEVHPDLVAAVVLCWTLTAGTAEGLWWAFAGGLAADLVGGGPFGALTLSLLPITAALGARDRQGGDPAIATAAALVGLGTFARFVLYALVLVVVGRPLPPFAALGATGAGDAVYSAALAVGMYPLMRLLHRRMAKQPAFDW